MRRSYTCSRPLEWLDGIDMSAFKVGDVYAHGFFGSRQRIAEVLPDSKEVVVVDAETGDGAYRTSVIHLSK